MPEQVEKLAVHTCWALLGSTDLGRLAVMVGERPDIFPINYAVDHGTLVFRSAPGAKMTGALSDAAVALEADGYDAATSKAWSVVVKGHAKAIQRIEDLIDTVDLPLFPWQAGHKNSFIRIDPERVTGRRFPVVEPGFWRSPVPEGRRTATD